MNATTESAPSGARRDRIIGVGLWVVFGVVIALARLVCPRANIPSTTALATLNRATGRELGLERGANVVMPNLTPTAYRAMYEIYPNKVCIEETPGQCHSCLKTRILSIGRRVGVGPGGRQRSSL